MCEFQESPAFCAPFDSIKRTLYDPSNMLLQVLPCLIGSRSASGLYNGDGGVAIAIRSMYRNLVVAPVKI